jgi:hypothetical protein
MYSSALQLTCKNALLRASGWCCSKNMCFLLNDAAVAAVELRIYMTVLLSDVLCILAHCQTSQVVGFDMVDDESKPERRPTKHSPLPQVKAAATFVL